MRKIKIAMLAAGMLFVAWLVPPAIHRALNYCPLRPDGVREAAALPQWARRYGFECGACHTTVPRLNQVGFNFRRSGFRMPDEVGKEAKFSGLKDVFGAKFVAQYQATASATDGSATNEKVAAARGFQVPQLTLYPFSGAYGNYWGARGELAFKPGDQTEIEQAYVRGTYPYKDLLLYAKAGIMHQIEGYGASDETLGNFGPLFLTNSAKNGDFDTLTTLMEQSQMGAEVGVGYNDTTASLAVFNGYNTRKNSAISGANNNHQDLRLFVNQMLGEKAAVSVEYLNGKTDWGYGGKQPVDASVDLTNPVFTINPAVAATWVNNYQRLVGYANYELLGEKLNILGGWMIGSDHMPNPGNNRDNTDKFNSTGWFAEAQSKIGKRFVAGLRGETFRPSLRTSGNRLSAVTLTGVVPVENFKFTTDYQIKRTQSSVGKDRTDNTLLAEVMYAF